MATQRIKGITIELNGDTTGLSKALKDVDGVIKTTQGNLRDIHNLLKLDPGNTELLAQKQKNLQDAIGATKDRLQQLKDAQGSVEQGTKEWDTLQREIVDTEQKLKSLEGEYKNFGSVAAQQVAAAGEKVKEFGGKVSDVGAGLSKGVTAPIAAIGTASVTLATELEDAVAKLNTIADTSEETGVPIDELKRQIIELSEQTGISAAEIANNVYDAISAGQQTGDAVGFVAESTKLAAAGFADSGQALDLLTTVLNAYGMEAENASKVSDVLIATQNKGKTTVGQLASTMGKIIPTANASGVSLEQLAAGYAIMTSKGIATAETTTYMNSMLNELSKSGATASKVIKEKTGQSFQELMGNGASLGDVLQILNQAATENGKSMNDLFGSAEAGKAALTLLSDGVDAFNSTLIDMRSASGATDEAFGKLDTTSRQASIALNELKLIGAEIGETIMPILADVLGTVRDVLGNLREAWEGLSPQMQDTIVKVGLIAAAVGPVLVVIGKVVTAIGSVMTVVPGIVGAISGVGTLLTGTLIPAIGGVIAAVAPILAAAAPFIAIGAAIVGVGVLVYKNWDTIKEKAGELWNAVKEKWSALKEATAQAWENIKQATSQKWEATKQAATQAAANIHTAVSEKWNAVKTATSQAWENIKTATANTFSNVLSGVREKVGNIKGTIVNGFNNAVSFIKSLPSQALKWGSDIIGNIVSGIRGAIGDVASAVSDVADTIFSFLHFSEPDEGPLSNFHTFAPDMIKELTSGIAAGIPAVEAATSRLAAAMVPDVDMGAQTLQGSASSARVIQGGIHLTIYGAQGQDENALADIIQSRLNTAVMNQEAVFA